MLLIRKLIGLEKRIADLEKRVQGQQKVIDQIREKIFLSGTPEEAVEAVLRRKGTEQFRFVLKDEQ